jgi:purine-cytosine permease-like protein
MIYKTVSIALAAVAAATAGGAYAASDYSKYEEVDFTFDLDP